MDTVPTEAGERIAHAIATLREFAGAINRNQAETLLDLWHDRAKLTSRQRQQVLAAFPSAS